MFSRKRVLFNAITFVPGAMSLPPVRRRAEREHRPTGGSNQARYCYSVWLRHLNKAHASGLDVDPKTVAELGPGDSIGMGLAAILTGVEQYYAFDVVAYANLDRNRAVLDELIELFRARADVPGPEEFPRVGPELDQYRFPHAVLTPERLEACLRPERIERIRRSLADCSSAASMIQYRAPWNTEAAIRTDSLDVVFSQAVLEHVDQLPEVYAALYRWLRPGGYMSHQIDFKCHGSAREWNGHWTYSDLMWKLVRGKDSCLINREPHSTHVRMIRETGFEILTDIPSPRASNLSRKQLAPKFRHLQAADLTTSEAFIQARKPHGKSLA